MNDVKTLYNPFCSVAVSSSAGSGKTHALTTRLIAMLLSGIRPQEILAITFTKLAANEIRKGLFRRLWAVESGDKDDISILCEILGVNERTLRVKVGVLKKYLIKHFSLLQISTIHSFFAKIIRFFPKETGIIVDLGVIDESTKERFLAESYEKFYELLAKNSILLDRIHDFLESYMEGKAKSEGIIREIYRQVDSKYYILKKSLDTEKRESKSIQEEFWRKRHFIASEDMVKKISFLLSTVSGYLDEFGKNKNLFSFVKGLQSFLKYRNPKALYELPAFKREVDGGLIRYLEKICKTLEEGRARQFKSAFWEVRDSLSKYLMAEMDYYTDTWFEIFRIINTFYGENKRSLQLIDFTDIELLALEFLTRLEDFGYLDYRIDAKIRYILIDEFQDTSESQWSSLKYIVRNGLSRGGNIFYVGDVKQAIYRWRGGEPYLFEEVRSDLGISKKSLRYNYRQNSRLLQFVNSLFIEIKNTLLPDFEYEEQLLPDDKRDKDRGYILIEQHEGREDLFHTIIENIDALQRMGVNLDDTAILCRKNSELEEIEKLLLESKIPYSSSGKSRLLRDYSVMDVENILRLVLNTDEEIYLAALLRSPIFQWDYEQLLSLKDKNGDLTLQKLKEVDGKIFYKINALINKSHYLSPSDFIRRVYEDLNILQIYAHKREVLLEFLELAYTFEQSYDNISLFDFANYLEGNRDSIPLKAGERGITVQTIHAAKGLEYHTVIVPFLSQPFKFRLDGSFIFKRDNEKRIEHYAVARSSYVSYLAKLRDLSGMLNETDRNYKIDELNILYVALTRARENLLLFPIISKRGETIGDILIHCLDKSYKRGEGLYLKEMGVIVKGDSMQKRRVKVYQGIEQEERQKLRKQLPKTEEGPFIDIESRRIGQLKGLIFHRALEEIRVPVADEKAISDILEKALAHEGMPYTQRERMKAFEDAKVSLLNVITDERLEKYFSAHAFCEVSSLSAGYVNLLGRIDRIWMSDEIEVIDFKTNELSSKEELNSLIRKYKEQVKAYCISLTKIYPARPVKGFLYFTDAELNDRYVSVFKEEV